MIRLRPVLKVIGVLLLLLGLLMLACLPFSYRFGAMDAEPLVLSAIVCLLAGLTVWVPQRRVAVRVGKREGYLIVAGGWMAMVSFGMLPYLFSGLIPTVPEAFFETMSGMTTTGATVLTDIEAAPRGLLFWRSLTQWIGGMGIIVLTVAIFPLLGIAGIELFTAEAPGPSADKIHPRIQETAKRLWLLYVGLTTLLALLLKLEGMSFYEALNHALTTMATGGFSTQNESIAAFPNPLIQYTLVVFMFLAGNNYTVTYWA
ncbi:MAG: TrkH family potassium uptake protein, partial [Bacteroidetes bacterium]